MEKLKLGNCCNIDMGQAPDGTSYNENNEGYPLIAGAGDFGEYYPTAKKYTSSPTKISEINDIILCIRATIGDINWSDKNYCLGRGVAGIRADKSKLDQNYLWHFISSNKEQLASQGTGSTFKQVSKSHIYDWEIPLPNLPTQTKIAQVLDKADQIRQKRKKAVELADEFLKSLFLEMFGDPVTNPMGWEVEKLGSLSTTKPSYGAGATAITYNSEFRYIRITDILENGNLNDDKKSADIDEKEIEKYILTDGDLLFARSGATVGKTFLFTNKTEKSIYAGYLIRFQLNKSKVLPQYIFNFTKTTAYQSWVKSHMKTVAQPNINAQQYSDLDIIVPPMELQIKFVEITNKIEKYKESLEKHSKSSGELFNSLSQQYFTK